MDEIVNIEDYLEGLRDARDLVRIAIWKSQEIDDLGINQGCGVEDPTERGYHAGLRAAMNIIEDLIAEGVE